MRHYSIKNLSANNNLLGSFSVQLLLSTSLGIEMVFTRLSGQDFTLAGNFQSFGK